MPDHCTFFKNRHGRLRESDGLRRLFEDVLHRCLVEGLVGGEGFAVDADTAYGTGEMLAWLVHERGIEPHVPVLDKSGRIDGTFSRADFA